MPNTTEVPEEWRYCDLKGKTTVTKLGDVMLAFLHDETVNPEKNVLKFRDIAGGNRDDVFKSTPQVNLKSGETETSDDLEIIASFDEQWFKFTIANGFKFKKDDGSPVEIFTDLDLPEDQAEKDRMNPIRP